MPDDPTNTDPLTALQAQVQDLSDAFDSLNYTTLKKLGPGPQNIQGSVMNSVNFKTGVSGWQMTPDGNLEANSGTFRGSLVANSLDIPDTTTANSAHINSSGDTWWGATIFGAAVASISKAGAAIFSSIKITGGSISGILNDNNTDISLLEKTHNLVFSVSSATQINWTSGTITMSNGRAFTISSGNTGTMSALTYIYLDPAISTTVLQTTTTYSTANGANKILLGTAQNNTVTASFIPYGPGQPLVDGANIGALSIVAGNIAASTITAAKLTVSQLSAIAADLGAITAGTIVLPTTGYVRSGQTDFNTGTGFFIGGSGGVAKLSIGVGGSNANNFNWDGTTLTLNGYVVTGRGAFGGNGADGALSISSGTTTISFGSANILYKNYTSISITGTANLTFSTPATNGSIAVLKSQAGVTVTSSTVPAIDVNSMGGAKGTGGAANADGISGSAGAGNIGITGFGVKGIRGTASQGTGGAGGSSPIYLDLGNIVGSMFAAYIGAGGAGGGGSNGTGSGGDGGTGGGGLIIECAGALNITSTLQAKGAVGSNDTPGAQDGGGGGGGGGGFIILGYNTLTANSGTYTVSGGAGGSGGSAGGNQNGGGGGGGGGMVTAGSAGSDATSGHGGTGGAGGTGYSLVYKNNSFA